MTEWMISGILGFVSGGALIWFFKDPILKWYKGAERFAQELKTKADAISAAVKH